MDDVFLHNYTSKLPFANTIRAYFTQSQPILQTFPKIFTCNLDVFAKFTPVFQIVRISHTKMRIYNRMRIRLKKRILRIIQASIDVLNDVNEGRVK